MQQHFWLEVPAQASRIAAGLGLQPWVVDATDIHVYYMPAAPLLCNALVEMADLATVPAYAEIAAVPNTAWASGEDCVRLVPCGWVPRTGASKWHVQVQTAKEYWENIGAPVPWAVAALAAMAHPDWPLDGELAAALPYCPNGAQGWLSNWHSNPNADTLYALAQGYAAALRAAAPDWGSGVA